MAATYASSCVYNIPMAYDAALSQTDGLEPHFARSRAKRHFLDCKTYTLGPMPTVQFIDHFLPAPASANDSGRLRSHKAFEKVPTQAKTNANIYEPLVSTFHYVQ